MGCIMSRTLKLSFKKGDWLAIVFVLILALSVAVFFLPKKKYFGVTDCTDIPEQSIDK